MRRLIWDASFRRALKQHTRREPRFQERILDVLDVLVENPFEPELKTHKLRGQLTGLWAAWAEYDCRIVFAFVPDPPNEDAIVLVDIGSHDEVY